MSAKTTLVLGASPKPDRYSHIAVRRLVAAGHPVLAVGLREARIEEVPIHTSIPVGSQVHTVTLYLNAQNQRAWYDRLLALRPHRIIFNPGAENEELASLARAQGAETLNACTLVMLATDQF